MPFTDVDWHCDCEYSSKLNIRIQTNICLIFLRDKIFSWTHTAHLQRSHDSWILSVSVGGQICQQWCHPLFLNLSSTKYSCPSTSLTISCINTSYFISIPLPMLAEHWNTVIVVGSSEVVFFPVEHPVVYSSYPIKNTKSSIQQKAL